MSISTSRQRAQISAPRFVLIEITFLVQAVIFASLLLWRRPPIVAGDLVGSLVAYVVSIIFLFILGVAAHAAWSLTRGSLRSYWNAIRTREWIVLSARLCVLQMAMAIFYSVLKLFIPLFNPGSFDRELWELDRLLFFGLSPNSFFLELFRIPAVLRFIDFIYGHIFFAFVMLAPAYFISRTSSTRRVAFFWGNALLWSTAVLMYNLIPSIGPIYRFPEVFSGTDSFFPNSRHLQIVLMKNYAGFIKVLQGVAPANLSIAFGVAAFPSMHVGFQSYVAMWVSRESRRAGLLIWLLTGITIVGSVATGWHYFVDAIAGLLLAWFFFVVARTIERRYEMESGGETTNAQASDDVLV